LVRAREALEDASWQPEPAWTTATNSDDTVAEGKFWQFAPAAAHDDGQFVDELSMYDDESESALAAVRAPTSPTLTHLTRGRPSAIGRAPTLRNVSATTAPAAATTSTTTTTTATTTTADTAAMPLALASVDASQPRSGWTIVQTLSVELCCSLYKVCARC
jgi:hypothetical protein